MVYKPPSAHSDEFTDGFNELLDNVPNGVSHTVMGDFNFIWVFFFFRIGKKFWYLCDRRHSLKFTLCKTREQIGFFVSFFRLAQDKGKRSDKICEEYIIWATYSHIRRGRGEVFGEFEVRKQFLLHNMQYWNANHGCYPILTRKWCRTNYWRGKPRWRKLF